MKPCAQLDSYLSRELEPTQSADFESHLRGCEHCGETAARWRVVEQELISIVRAAEPAIPVAGEIGQRQLVQRARTLFGAPQRRAYGLRPVFVAAAALIVAGFFFMLRDRVGGQTEMPLRIDARLFEPGKAQSAKVTARLDRMIAVPAQSRILLKIGDDRIGLGSESNLTIAKASKELTQIVLKRGTAVCSVDPRNGKGDFVVTAGEVEVRVVGTAFAVGRTKDEDVEVSVLRGSVEVSAPGRQTRRVSAGQCLTGASKSGFHLTGMTDEKVTFLQQLLSETPQKAPADRIEKSEEALHKDTDYDKLATNETPKNPLRGSMPNAAQNLIDVWRTWIIEGRLTDAQNALESHLAQQPRDGEAWSLLADCRRKNGDWKAAVQAYRKVVAFASPQTADRARFRAGALLQDKLGLHSEAIELLEEYLRSSQRNNTLRAEAMFRLAQSYLAIGQNQKATALLNEIVLKHNGSSPAARARQILSETKAVD